MNTSKSIKKDKWVTVAEALLILGHGWKYKRRYIGKDYNHLESYDGHTTIRVYDGTEHPKARKDMAIINSGALTRMFMKRNHKRSI